MAMLQQYYTSCENGRSGGAGFQIKAMSENITNDQIKILNSLLGYQIPLSMLDAPVETHPVGFRYKRIDEDTCALLCSQSNGGDEYGRPGNFFAHSVITSPQDFNIFPPIMFWRSPFWKTSDPSSNLSIPEQTSFQESPTLLLDSVWDFLQQGNQREWFGLLLDAVLQFPESKRPIVILDDTDNIANWIMAVTMAMPPVLRTLIGFATYHHNPYQSPYTITGTTRDSAFRFAPEEYISYFILNAYDNKISTISESSYKQYVSKCFFESTFSEKLGDFYQVCNRLIPISSASYQWKDVEAVTYFYITIHENSLRFSEPNAKIGISYFIDYLNKFSNPMKEELEDLARIIDFFGNELISATQTRSVREFCTALQLNKQLNDDYLDRIELDLDILQTCLLRGNEQVGRQLDSTYRILYPLEEMNRVVSRTEFLKNLLTSMQDIPLHVHTSVWKYLLPFVRLNVTNRAIIYALMWNSIKPAIIEAGIDAEHPTPAGDEVIKAMVTAFQTDRKVCIDAFMQQEQSKWNIGLAWIYYQSVQDLPLDQRKSYRSLLGHNKFVCEIYEFRNEALRFPPKQAKTSIQRWVAGSDWNQSQSRDLLNQAIDAIWSKGDGAVLNIVAEDCLMDKEFAHDLEEHNMSKILASYFPEMGFRFLTNEQLSMFIQYKGHSSLSSNQKAVIGGSYAMSTGSFLPNSPKMINDHFVRLSETQYREEVGKLIARFFHSPMKLTSHLEMLLAAYVYQYEGVFWGIYWDHFTVLMMNLSKTSDFVKLMNFWFEQSFTAFENSPYMGQQFFLQLPTAIAAASEKKGYKQAATAIEIKAKHLRWYKLVSPNFKPPKDQRLFGGKFFKKDN